jgi:hypothetical protein
MNDEILLVLDEEARRTDVEGVWPARSIEALAQSGYLGLTLASDSAPPAACVNLPKPWRRSQPAVQLQR